HRHADVHEDLAPPESGTSAWVARGRFPDCDCPCTLTYFTCLHRQPQPYRPTRRHVPTGPDRYQPYVSRGPRLPCTRHWPGRRGWAPGPSTLTRRTAPSPSSALSLRTRSAASSRSWVAQAVESAMTVSSPSA